MRVCSLAALVLAVCVATAAAQEMRTPHIVRTPVDWNEATDLLDQEAGPGSIERLNQAAGKLFANIAASPVPVLLPFNGVQLLRDTAAGANGTNGNGTNHAAASYLIEVRPASFFQAGPGGYDAVFSVYAKDMPGSDVNYPDRIDVHISGSALLYELEIGRAHV